MTRLAEDCWLSQVLLSHRLPALSHKTAFPLSVSPSLMSFAKGIYLPLSNSRSQSFFSVPCISSQSRLAKRDAFFSTAPSSHHSFSLRSFRLRNPRVYADGTQTGRILEEGEATGEFEGDLAVDGAVFQSTLRLVECSMFAAVAGLAYFLSNSLAIESYFGCFFSLPIVISSMRWGVAGGRKTMVATAMLLLTLSGPVKALTYLLMHGLVGLALGSLWRLRASWGLSIAVCTFVRALGALGYVLISSFLIRENILTLITVNLHASITYVLAAVGISTVPSMDVIYAVFGFVLLLNCVFFVFLLHVLYALFLTKFGMRAALRLPQWLEKAI